MFDDENVPLRIADIAHKKLEKDDHEYPLVELTLELNPLSAERARQVSEFMKSTLFTRGDATVHPQLQGATFDIVTKPQQLVVKAAPDQDKASFTIDEAKIGALHARRSKQTSTWRLVFTATFSPKSEHQLAQVVDCYLKTQYLTFADAHPDLFSELGKEARKTRAAAAASATAH